MAKGQCKIYRPEQNFRKGLSDYVEKIIVDQLHLSKRFPQFSFKSISCQETCKKCVVMNKCNSRRRRCFKFQVQEFQSGPIELWIRAAKFCKKIPIRFENIDKIHSEFPRSGMHIPTSLSNFVELYSSYNTWTSYVIPLCGTIYNEIHRFSNVQSICLELYWNCFVFFSLKLWSCWSYHSDRMTEFLLSFNFLLIFNP